MSDILTLRGFCAGYGRKQVLKGIDLTLKGGELTVLLGENGCGKTTLLRSAAGLLKGSGTCLLKGNPLSACTNAEKAKLISYLPQQGGVSLPMNALDLILLGFYPEETRFKTNKEDEIKRAMELLAAFGAEKLADEEFTRLSGGQKQLILLCRALLRNVPLLLLDEPGSALDLMNRRRVYGYLSRRAQETGEAVLVSCHDINQALRFADRILLMKDGLVAGDTRPASDCANDVRKAFHTIWPGAEIIERGGKYLLTGEFDNEA